MDEGQSSGHLPHLGDVLDVVVALGLDPTTCVDHHPAQVSLPVCLNRKLSQSSSFIITVFRYMYLHPLPDNVSQPGHELLVQDVVVAGAGVTVVIHQGRVLRTTNYR